MDSRQIINHRQISNIVLILLTGHGIHFVQREISRLAKADAWSVFFLPVLYAILMALFYAYLIGRFPGMNLFQIVRFTCGKWFGTLMNILLLFYSWLILTKDLSGTAYFVSTTILPTTPQPIILTLLIIVLMVYGNTGIEVTARVNEIIIVMFILVLITLPVLLLNEFSLTKVQPTLTSSGQSWFSGNWITLGVFGELFVLGNFLHSIWIPKQFHAAVRHGIVLGAAALSGITLLGLLGLGAHLTSRTLFPSFTLIQQIRVTDFLDRLDPVILSVWLPASLIKIVVVYIGFLVGIQSITGSNTQDYTLYNKITAWFLLASSLLAYRGIIDVLDFTNYSLPVIALFQPIFALALFALSMRKTNNADFTIRETGNQPHQPFRYSYRTWQWLTNGLLLGCGGLLAIGMAFGLSRPAIAAYAGLGYGLLFATAIFTSYMEMYVVRDYGIEYER